MFKCLCVLFFVMNLELRIDNLWLVFHILSQLHGTYIFHLDQDDQATIKLLNGFVKPVKFLVFFLPNFAVFDIVG
jgi:hypothetical protein